MTFAQFKESMRIMTADEFGKLVSDSQWEGDNTQFRVYGNSFYIEILKDGRHMLTIENRGWIEPETSLAKMESILFEFAESAE